MTVVVVCPGTDGRGCLTLVALGRGRCSFCRRVPPIELKRCMRCRRDRPRDVFAWHGRYRICADCLLTAPMTPAERTRSAVLSRVEYRQRLRRRRPRRVVSPSVAGVPSSPKP